MYVSRYDCVDDENRAKPIPAFPLNGFAKGPPKRPSPPCINDDDHGFPDAFCVVRDKAPLKPVPDVMNAAPNNP